MTHQSIHSKAAVFAPLDNSKLYTEHAVIVLWPAQASCPDFAPSRLLVHLAEHEKLKSPSLPGNNHQCVINILPTLNPKHSTIQATTEKINIIPKQDSCVPKKLGGIYPGLHTRLIYKCLFYIKSCTVC